MPHLPSVLRNCFLLSTGTVGARGVGRGETHESVNQQQPSWIESLCEWYWSGASENCSAQHKIKDLAYLCLTCSYCCIFDWQYLCVGHTYAWYLFLCFFETEEEKKRNVTVLYLFQLQQQLFVKTFFCSYTCLQYYHCLTPGPCKLCVCYIHLSSLSFHFVLTYHIVPKRLISMLFRRISGFLLTLNSFWKEKWM